MTPTIRYTVPTPLPFPRRSSLKLPDQHLLKSTPASPPRPTPRPLPHPLPKKRVEQLNMELMNFFAALMVVAIINAAPTVDVQRTDPQETPTTTGNGAPLDPDAVSLPGPTGTDVAGNDPAGTAIPSCVPNDAQNVCQLTTDTGSPNPQRNDCILIV